MSSSWKPRTVRLRAWVAPGVFAAIVSTLAACPGELEDPDSFLNFVPDCDVEGVIFPTQCGTSGCHDANAAQAGLDLVSPGVAGRVNGVPAQGGTCSSRLLANPLDPQASALFNKLTPSYCGDSRMPLGMALNESDQACILAWIEALTPVASTTTASSSSGGGAGGQAGQGGQGGQGGN